MSLCRHLIATLVFAFGLAGAASASDPVGTWRGTLDLGAAPTAS